MDNFRFKMSEQITCNTLTTAPHSPLTAPNPGFEDSDATAELNFLVNLVRILMQLQEASKLCIDKQMDYVNQIEIGINKTALEELKLALQNLEQKDMKSLENEFKQLNHMFKELENANNQNPLLKELAGYTHPLETSSTEYAFLTSSGQIEYRRAPAMVVH